MARQTPDRPAVAEAQPRKGSGPRTYRSFSFAELERDSARIAQGLRRIGVEPGTRLALLARPGVDFVSLTFAIFRAGAVAILVDPGMGKGNMIECLAAAEPQGFVAIPQAQAARIAFRRRFPLAKFNVTIGARWFWRGTTLANLRAANEAPTLETWTPTSATDLAAIIFTTGSTGPPKGVAYEHGNFDRQVTEIRDFYGIRPGAVDLACFPLFGLFDAAMGVTAVFPEMDASRPASVAPPNILEAVRDWNVTQAFGSPAIWNVVGAYCKSRGGKFSSLKRIFSAGAPVPPRVLASLRECLPDEGEIHTPYGATEALPLASIESREVLGETSSPEKDERGTCVGRRFPGVAWKTIEIVDGPLGSISETRETAAGEIGELIVQGPVVTRKYVTRIGHNALAKIADGDSFWHRMGDVGWLDDQGRFWYCGRMSQRVVARERTYFTDPCENIFNRHPVVFRSALVGIPALDRADNAREQTPIMIVELWPDKRPKATSQRASLIQELVSLGNAHPTTRGISTVLTHPAFPVDIRHNAKIFREKLAVWAAGQLRSTKRLRTASLV